MKCPQCQAENREGAQFCRECGTRFGAACPACGVKVEPGSKFCDACGATLSVAPTPASVPARFDSPESYTPKHLAEKILTSKSALEGERKQVTVLFADLKGSMELLADRDPEEARKLLDPVLERLMEAVHRYEGTVNQVMGDGIMALFGAPLAHEDHAVRACYAALRMQEALRRYTDEVRRAHGVEVRIRVGLNSGEVVVRAVGNDLHMDYTAVGQTTHLAARMEQLAAPGTILLTGETVRLAEGFVQVKLLGPVPVKGLEAPIEVYEVMGAGPVRRRLEAAAARGLTRFVGRQAELEVLRETREKAGSRHGQVVAVVGEPGVGKSRLFWEFTHSHRTHGWLVLEAGSVSYGKATTYLPVINLLKAYFKIHDLDEQREVREKVTGKLLTLDEALKPTLPAFLALLDVPVEDAQWQGLDPPERRQRTLDAVKRLLLRESQVLPLCLVFEDLHWIDSETQAFLDGLVESLPSARVLLLVNYRPEYQHGWGSKTYYAQLRIDPLPPESAEELFQALLGDGASLEPLKRLLTERTEGNPFFLEESVRTLVETQVLVGERGAFRLGKAFESIQVPATVQAVLAARIDRLAPDDKRLLQSAAVVGKDVPFALLLAIAETPEENLRAGLTHLRAGEFLYEAHLFPDLEYTFKHALTHEVVYGSLLQDRKKVLHARLVEAIERLAGDRRTEHAEALARHAERAELWDKAVDYLREAGTKAYTRGALQESLDRYEQALRLLSRLPISPDNIRRAIDVRLDHHMPLNLLGQISRNVELHQEAEQLARELNDARRLGVVLIRMAHYSWFNAQYRPGIQYARQALDIATSLDALELHISASFAAATNHAFLGEFRTAVDLARSVVEGPRADLAKRLPTPYGSLYITSCAWLAAWLGYIGDFRDALQYADRATREAEELDRPQARAFAGVYRGYVLRAQGELEEARSVFKRALDLSETHGLLYWVSNSSIHLGHTLAESGQPAEGVSYIEKGLALQKGMGTTAGRPAYYAQWAAALLLDGKIREARQAADQALQLAVASGERGSEALALLALGRICPAASPPDLESALNYYEQAKNLAEELGLRPLLARCHLGLGTLYRRTGDGPKAQGHLTTATTMLRDMDMRFWLQQAEAELKELGSKSTKKARRRP